MAFDWGLMGLIAAGLLVTGLLGAIIPIHVISRIDPVSVIVEVKKMHEEKLALEHVTKKFGQKNQFSYGT